MSFIEPRPPGPNHLGFAVPLPGNAATTQPIGN
jgi:hypothetical protein